MKLRPVHLINIIFFIALYGCAGKQMGAPVQNHDIKDGHSQIAYKKSGKAVTMNRILTANDPNANPNWDWTSSDPVKLYIHSRKKVLSISKPYFSNMSNIFSFCYSDYYPDIKPRDGWVLIARDFGTPDHHVDFPYFLLYNKYRGILRLFLFTNHTLTPKGSSFITAKLEVINTNNSNVQNTAIFSLANDNSSTLEHPHTIKQATVSSLFITSFNMFDFYIGGYDPGIMKHSDIFKISIFTNHNFQKKPENALTKNSLIGMDQTGSTHSGVIRDNSENNFTFQNISKEFSTTTGLKRSFKNLLKIKNPGQKPWWSTTVKKWNGLSDPRWITSLAPLTGALHFFMGGGSTIPNQPLPVTTIENTTLIDTSATHNRLATLYVAIPGAPGPPAIFKTSSFYHRPTGLFNLTRKPVVRVEASGIFSGSGCKKANNHITSNVFHPAPYSGTNCSFDDELTYKIKVNPVYNNSVFKSESILIGLEKKNQTIKNFTKLSSGEATFTRHYSNYLDYIKNLHEWKSTIYKVAMKIVLHPKNAPNNFTPTTIYKDYTPRIQLQDHGFILH